MGLGPEMLTPPTVLMSTQHPLHVVATYSKLPDSIHWSVVLHSENLVSPSPSPLLSACSTDLGHSTGVTSAVFFAGLLAGVALAGPAGALSVVCYHWKKMQAKTRGKWVAVDSCHYSVMCV